MIRVVDKDNNEIVCYKYKDGPQVYGICESTFRKRAREAGATIKLGKTVLIYLKNICFLLPFQRWNNIIRKIPMPKNVVRKLQILLT